jgi:hypothetical protein
MAKKTTTTESVAPKAKAPSVRPPANGAKTASASSARAKKTDDVAAVTQAHAEPSPQQIAERAYELYLARGASDGGAEHDWLRAESELRSR